MVKHRTRERFEWYANAGTSHKIRAFSQTRTRQNLSFFDTVPKNSGVPVSAYFRAFPPLSARKQMLSGTLVSTVSVCSGRVCGINCGQAKHPECSSRRIRGVFCRLYGNSIRPKSQGLSRNKFCPAVDKEKGIEKRREK